MSELRDSSEMYDEESACTDDYPEHDFKVVDERDGIATLICRRCGAESWEEDE